VADRSTETIYPGWDIFACQDNYVHTAPVGSFQANAFGIHDMLGNVFEWVTDCWNESYAGAPSDGAAWVDGDCGYRVLRGGSWFTPPGYVRTAFRNRFAPDYRSSSFGFRVARIP
jgi:formylglycine-generating enzyme required for sulfatase activity